MAVSVLLVFLLSVSEVIISECPPSSGKTLDVYNNSCIGFIGIYLMHNGNCYPNGSYFHDDRMRSISSSLMCSISPNSTLNGGEWVGPSGSSVNCSTNPVRCNFVFSPANISLYLNGDFTLSHDDGWYKCCLPTSCSDPNTNMITANIFSKCSHCTSTHCHLLLIYCRMGTD